MNMPVTEMRQCATDRARACFLRACELDVDVRKPGNVSWASAGHGMTAEHFLASAKAVAGPLFERGASVGERIEASVEATWAVAGCNTNLGIVLLCAPIARAVELRPDATAPEDMREAVEFVLGELDLSDAQAAFRAIARARPGGLANAPEQDVRHPPSVDLRAAMALAAHRDSIARQYRDGYDDLFELGVPTLGTRFSLMAASVSGAPDAGTVAAVQRLYLALLSSFPDSHIVRIHGETVAHIVMTAAQGWRVRQRCHGGLDADPEFAEWDASLKADRINPGTTADLTVAALLIAGLTGSSRSAPAPAGSGGTDRDT